MPGRVIALVATTALLVAVSCSSSSEDAGPPPSTPGEPESTTIGPRPPLPRPGEITVVAEGLEVPWGVSFFPEGSGELSGSAIVGQRPSGELLVVSPSGQVRPAGTVPGVVSSAEGGLLGLAVSPAFADDRTVYAYVAGADDNRIVRFQLSGPEPDGSVGIGETDPVVVGIATASIHDGGRLAFGPDGFLYAATGDAGGSSRSQDLASLNGKILRMTGDGSPAPDNPFPGSLVWSLGHRNVEGLAWDDAGRLYATEFGASSFDELNMVEPGANYGWPEVEGPGGGDRFVDPVVTWRPSESSPSGVAHAAGALWVGALRGQGLWKVPLVGGAVGVADLLFEGEYGRIRTVVAAPDGSLWLTTSNMDGRGDPAPSDDRILRLHPPNGA